MSGGCAKYEDDKGPSGKSPKTEARPGRVPVGSHVVLGSHLGNSSLELCRDTCCSIDRAIVGSIVFDIGGLAEGSKRLLLDAAVASALPRACWSLSRGLVFSMLA